MSHSNKTPLALAIGTAFAASLAVSSLAQAATSNSGNPFAMSELSSGYMQVAKEGKCGEGKCGASKNMKKDKTMKEGKCGEGKNMEEGKSMKEGKCGEGKSMKEGKCGGSKNMKKDKTMKEGKCGEGKCGGNK